ncbi:MAG: ribosome silencing factor [Bacteroidales bacterium]|jgi:ribosome-associated protein
MIKEKNDVDQLVNFIINAILSKKGIEVVSMNLKEIPSRVCDFFIICHGTSTTHIQTIRDSVVEEVFNSLKEKPWHIEGSNNSNWLLIDYSNVVVHVFLENARKFYDIESLWADAIITKHNDI